MAFVESLLGGLQREPPEFWTKAVPYALENLTPLEKRLSLWSWTVAKTDYVTRGHQVTVRLESPVMI